MIIRLSSRGMSCNHYIISFYFKVREPVYFPYQAAEPVTNDAVSDFLRNHRTNPVTA